MPNLLQKNLNGQQHVRFRRVVANNPFGGEKSATFEPEVVFERAGKPAQTRDLTPFTVVFSAEGSFPVINPTNDQPTGQTMTHAQLYAVLYSLARFEAEKSERLAKLQADAGD